MRDRSEATDAVKALTAGHGASLLRLGYQLTHDRDSAQDLLQESLLRVFEAWGRNEVPTDELARIAYARLVMVRLSVRWKTAAAKRAAADAPNQAVPQPGDDVAVMAVWDALGKLKPRERAAIVLHHYLDLPYEQVARQLGCRPGSARSLCSRSLVQLRSILEQQAVEPRVTPRLSGKGSR